jgi:hypothetical protein
MTEEGWLACTNPQPMLYDLRDKVSDRKLRLFGCACCWRLGNLIDDRLRAALDIAERYSDGAVSNEDLARAYDVFDNGNRYDRGVAFHTQLAALSLTCHPGQESSRRMSPAFRAAEGGCISSIGMLSTAAANTSAQSAENLTCLTSVAEMPKQVLLLHDIFGNPFRPVAAEPGWLTWNHGTVPAIARHIYEDRAFHDMPILADALEDAGCTNTDLLDHCRGPGPHVRGCWAVDLLLGKT